MNGRPDKQADSGAPANPAPPSAPGFPGQSTSRRAGSWKAGSRRRAKWMRSSACPTRPRRYGPASGDMGMHAGPEPLSTPPSGRMQHRSTHVPPAQGQSAPGTPQMPMAGLPALGSHKPAMQTATLQSQSALQGVASVAASDMAPSGTEASAGGLASSAASALAPGGEVQAARTTMAASAGSFSVGTPLPCRRRSARPSP